MLPLIRGFAHSSATSNFSEDTSMEKKETSSIELYSNNLLCVMRSIIPLCYQGLGIEYDNEISASVVNPDLAKAPFFSPDVKEEEEKNIQLLEDHQYDEDCQFLKDLGKMVKGGNTRHINQDRELETPSPKSIKEEKNVQTDALGISRLQVAENEEQKEFQHVVVVTSIENHVHQIAPAGVDLTGTWKIIVDTVFTEAFDQYLKCLGFNKIARIVALGIIGQNLEQIQQLENGRKLYIKGTNAKGVWERTLMTQPHKVLTAEKEEVDGEAWWEGHRHRSFLRGSSKYGGGDFESIRYIDQDGLYICDSIFHFNDTKKTNAYVQWRFQKVK